MKRPDSHCATRVINVEEANLEIWKQFAASKTKAALDGGLGVILCVGETLEVCSSSETMFLADRIPATRGQQDD